MQRTIKVIGNFRVHRVGRQVDFAGPRNGFAVDEDLLEKPFIQERGKRASQILSP